MWNWRDFEPGLVDAELRAECPQRREAPRHRKCLDFLDLRAAVQIRPARGSPEIIDHDVDDRQRAAGIPGRRIERRRQPVFLEHRQHVCEGRNPAVVDRDRDRGLGQAAIAEPVDGFAEREHGKAGIAEPRHPLLELFGRDEHAVAIFEAWRHPEPVIAEDAQFGARRHARHFPQAGGARHRQKAVLQEHRAAPLSRARWPE